MVWFHIILGTSVTAIIFIVFAVFCWAGCFVVREIRSANQGDSSIEDGKSCVGTQMFIRDGHEQEMVCNVDSEIK